MVYFAIYNYEVLKDDSIVFDNGNSCLNDLSHELQKALNQSGISFRKCYLLKDEDVEKFLNVVNETQNMEQFRKDNDECLKRNSHFYEFNCYVQVVSEENSVKLDTRISFFFFLGTKISTKSP